MQRSLSLLFALATLTVAASAQSAPDSSSYMQPQAAPIQRNYAGPERSDAAPRVTSTQPIPGVILRVDEASSVKTVSATADVTELRIEHGRANVSVHHPEHSTQILVDLPGGQTALLKDGLYTFNADTNTVRVLMGEADVFPGSSNTAVKVKEDHQFAFGTETHSTEVNFNQARIDLLEGTRTAPRGEGYNGDGPYYPSGYPYYYGYPGFYGYPYGYGYPFGFGIGFGYYGGFGGFRGGFGGFHGGRR
jgi:hypothetical protein